MEEIYELKKIIGIVLTENYDSALKLQWRCHELARVIGNKLSSFNWKVRVNDGIVIYDLVVLYKDFAALFFKDDDEKSEESKELEKGLLIEIEHLTMKYENEKLRVIHSWCEVCNSQNEIIVIDYHGIIRLSENHIMGLSPNTILTAIFGILAIMLSKFFGLSSR
jgi:hypothetical protein